MSAAASKQAFRQWLGEDLLFLRLPAALLGLRLGALREKLKHKYALPFSGFAAVTRSAGLQSAVWTYIYTLRLGTTPGSSGASCKLGGFSSIFSPIYLLPFSPSKRKNDGYN